MSLYRLDKQQAEVINHWPWQNFRFRCYWSEHRKK